MPLSKWEILCWYLKANNKIGFFEDYYGGIYHGILNFPLIPNLFYCQFWYNYGINSEIRWIISLALTVRCFNRLEFLHNPEENSLTVSNYITLMAIIQQLHHGVLNHPMNVCCGFTKPELLEMLTNRYFRWVNNTCRNPINIFL